MEYHVISPDGIPMTSQRFASEQAAFDAIPLLCKRYERQGYYLTRNWQRIPFAELRGHLLVAKA